MFNFIDERAVTHRARKHTYIFQIRDSWWLIRSRPLTNPVLDSWKYCCISEWGEIWITPWMNFICVFFTFLESDSN